MLSIAARNGMKIGVTSRSSASKFFSMDFKHKYLRIVVFPDPGLPVITNFL